MKKLSIIYLAFVSTLSYSEIFDIFPGEVAGRDLDAIGMHGFGHVALTTGDYMKSPTTILIEVLNEDTVIQLNELASFKNRSHYWGTRWGIGDGSNRHRNVLVEANHQRWWQADYTLSGEYYPGTGDLGSGESISKGKFRCDTFLAYVFATQKYNQLVNLTVMAPVNIYKTFPKANNQFLIQEKISTPLISESDLKFQSLSSDDLNKLDLSEFLAVSDIPIKNSTPLHIEIEWRFAADKNLNTMLRGVFIDRLSMIKDKEAIKKFLDIFKNNDDLEIRKKLLIALNFYSSKNLDINDIGNKKLLRDFYDSILNTDLSNYDMSSVLHGYMNINNANEILLNRSIFDIGLYRVTPQDALRVYISLIHKSIELENIYIAKLIYFLTKSNSYDLDEMFFGTTAIGYKSFKNPQTINQIKEYMYSVKKKYNQKSLIITDPYYSLAKKEFNNLEEVL